MRHAATERAVEVNVPALPGAQLRFIELPELIREAWLSSRVITQLPRRYLPLLAFRTVTDAYNRKHIPFFAIFPHLDR